MAPTNPVSINSTVKLNFEAFHKGFVKIELDAIINRPKQNTYTLMLLDTCYEIVEEKRIKSSALELKITQNVEPTEDDYETILVEKVLATANRPSKTYSYKDLNDLAHSLGKTIEGEVTMEKINELFQDGLLAITQKECIDGIAGDGLGLYFSKVNEWTK